MELGRRYLKLSALAIWHRWPEGQCSLSHLWLFLRWWVGASSPFRCWKETTQALRWWGIPGILVVVFFWDHKATYPIAKPNMDRDLRLVTPCYAYIIYWLYWKSRRDVVPEKLLGCSFFRHRFEASLETWRTAGLSMFSRVFIFQVLKGLVDLSGKFFIILLPFGNLR